MTPTVVVVGLGGIGSAALAAIARRGCRAIGIDRFEPPHQRGGTHGGSRIIRAAYFEHPDYVPLARASLEAWRRIERETGERCLHANGVLLLGPPTSVILEACATSARLHGVPIETFGAREIVERWPMFQIPRLGGRARAGRRIRRPGSRRGLTDLARRHGAEIWPRPRSSAWTTTGTRSSLARDQVVRAPSWPPPVPGRGRWCRNSRRRDSSRNARRSSGVDRPWPGGRRRRPTDAGLADRRRGERGCLLRGSTACRPGRAGRDEDRLPRPRLARRAGRVGGRSEPEVVQRFHRDVSRYLPGARPARVAAVPVHDEPHQHS